MKGVEYKSTLACNHFAISASKYDSNIIPVPYFNVRFSFKLLLGECPCVATGSYNTNKYIYI
jgi:hypothetical protein